MQLILAGILPFTNFDNNLISLPEEANSLPEEAELEAEIIDLIECLPINVPLSIQEYIEIDNYMNIEEDLSIDNIVDIVNGQDESESEGEKEEEIVKLGMQL
ncbi:13304_t:CDS:2 [Racocetra fulgida]|uniref:13304_t:CDS:1 n=1 Tax=Racocetra fulgida TaxID=60492 RepID=A0A9N9CPC9_9GLOM|nr:13304_t:CDS:2 [Racocetra fulgida]